MHEYAVFASKVCRNPYGETLENATVVKMGSYEDCTAFMCDSQYAAGLKAAGFTNWALRAIAVFGEWYKRRWGVTRENRIFEQAYVEHLAVKDGL